MKLNDIKQAIIKLNDKRKAKAQQLAWKENTRSYKEGGDYDPLMKPPVKEVK